MIISVTIGEVIIWLLLGIGWLTVGFVAWFICGLFNFYDDEKESAKFLRMFLCLGPVTLLLFIILSVVFIIEDCVIRKLVTKCMKLFNKNK